MARKGGKGKPTRKEIDSAIQNLYQGLQYIGQKLEYLEGYAKSTETALDLYIKFKKDEKGFSERVKDKCEKEISTLEPCFKVSYGFSNEDESFFEDIYLILHLECLNDEEVLSAILSSLKKN
jgi:hypothetical protein